jgi:hypothetical protein
VTTIDEHGNVQQWTAVYWRHFGKYTEECDSFAEAYRFLTSGEDYESLSSEAILGPEGAVLMDAAALIDCPSCHRCEFCSEEDPDAGLSAMPSQPPLLGPRAPNGRRTGLSTPPEAGRRRSPAPARCSARSKVAES